MLKNLEDHIADSFKGKEIRVFTYESEETSLIDGSKFTNEYQAYAKTAYANVAKVKLIREEWIEIIDAKAEMEYMRYDNDYFTLTLKLKNGLTIFRELGESFEIRDKEENNG